MCNLGKEYGRIVLEMRDNNGSRKNREISIRKKKRKKINPRTSSRKIHVSINAVSKWERGICLMDMSLLKPLCKILDVNVVDILSGEKVTSNQMQEKYEESIEDIVKINEMKSKSFGVYGMIILYVILLLYKVFYDICFYDIVALLCGFNTFKFIYKYKLEKDKSYFIISAISFLVCVYMFIEYIMVTI